MNLRSDSFADGLEIPAQFALGVIAPKTHMAFSHNRNPHLAWDDVPPGTKSFALIVHDKDVPSRGDDVNKEDREVPADLPRVDFFHWILLDMPASMRDIAAGSHSDGVTPGGKPGPQVSADSSGIMRHGINDYTGYFADDPKMRGDYYGYDGPCPPWNDSLVHHYIFTLHALDVVRLDVRGELTGATVREAIQGRILAEAHIMGTYSLNPDRVEPPRS
jgi:Raf kinase inhibitor-like YbhB/YbcL family protein